MIGSAGGTIELFTRFETHGNVAFTAQFDDFLKTRAGGAFDDEDAVERARGAECFPDGMDSRDRSHYDKGTFMSAHENLPVPPALEIPDKLYFRIGDVARLAGIKPYVLRFWETEFPTLGPRKSGTGHRLYRRKDGHAKSEGTRSGTRAARAAKAARTAPAAQTALFSAPDTAVLDAVRKELRELAEMLK